MYECMCVYGKQTNCQAERPTQSTHSRGEWRQSGEPRWQRPEKPAASSEKIQRVRKYEHVESSKSMRCEVEKLGKQ